MNDISNPYDPYPYNPMMRHFYTGTQLPQEIAAVAQANPGKAQHLNAVYQFEYWLRSNHPDLHAAVMERHPNALDATKVVLSGALNAGTNKMPSSITAPAKGMAGLGQDATGVTTYFGGPDTSVPAVTDATATASDTSIPPVTQWGQTIADLAKNYLQFDAQKQIVDLNIKRAEQGLPPVDASTIAPTVNVGVSGNVQTLGYLAIGAVVLFGLMSMFGKRRSK